MKKFVDMAIIACIFFALTTVCYADNGFSLSFNDNSYTIAAASAQDSGFPFRVSTKGGTVTLSDTASGIDITVKYNKFDGKTFDILRQYYNDSTSSKDELFDRYVDLEKSYIITLQDHYKQTFLFGEPSNPDAESGMKLFYDGSEKIFGHDSFVYIYNIERSDKLSYSEKTHIDMIIPVSSEYAVIDINAELDCSKLNPDAVVKLTKILSCLRFGDLPSVVDAPGFLSDKKLLAKANAGIYANESNLGMDSLIPYMQNSIGGNLGFQSYKIAPNEYLSITTEPSDPSLNSEDVIKDRISSIKTFYKQTAKSLKEGKADIKQSTGKNALSFSYLEYDLDENGSMTHVLDYFADHGPVLYKFELRTRFKEPSAKHINEVKTIIAPIISGLSADTDTTPASIFMDTANGMQAFISSDEGYAFNYPSDWVLSDVSKNIKYDEYKLILPEMSGPLEIFVSEGELNTGLNITDIPACLAGQGTPQYDKYIKKYTPPYKETVSKFLANYSVKKGDTTYVCRLINYIDPNGRSRLSYTIDIVKGQKIRSMFITVGEYRTSDGKMSNPSINELVNAIAASFRLVDNPASATPTDSADTMNAKVIFLEQRLKEIVDRGLTVSSVEDYNTDGSFYTVVDNSRESGYYKVRLDYPGRKLSIEEKTLKSTILANELEKLYKIYDRDTITGLELNEKDMTITLKTILYKGAPPFIHTYKVNVNLSDNGISWNTVRFDHPNVLRTNCKTYFNSILGIDTKIYFVSSDEFKDIDLYSASGTMYETAVFVEMKSTSGYFTIKVNPINDEISLCAYNPLDGLLENIKSKYGFEKNGYIIKNFTLDRSRFVINLELVSKVVAQNKADGQANNPGIVIQSYSIRFNPEIGMLEY